MNTLLLKPSDVLFFRDGRPMSGSLSGHGAAWPLPTVTNAALHAALHRAKNLEVSHSHRRGRSGDYSDTRDRKFGCLKTVGPFPVCTASEASTWFFPRPLDAGVPDSPSATFLPLLENFESESSSLPKPLLYPVANTQAPTKTPIKPWWSEGAWCEYLGTQASDPDAARHFFKLDSDFSAAEQSIGIGIDPDTGSQDGEHFYSAQYLRLREDWRLGILADAIDKEYRTADGNPDLIHGIFPNSGKETLIIVGGQQRICSVVRTAPERLPLPLGKTSGFTQHDGKFLVKWALLSPAVYPTINNHSGGWLLSWVDMQGEVQLLDGPGKNFARRHRITEGKRIPATLVAAMVGKPVPVTGYALDNGLDDRLPGPKPTHLAVPAGSVYYFACASAEAAEKLAAALNWHGDTSGTAIRNRRSTLFGEKGFGLGVCSTWNFFQQSV